MSDSELYLGKYEHGRPSTYNRGCRCAECRRDACRRATEKRAKNKERLARGEVQINHGRYGYTNWGCRCDICTAAHVEACRPATSRWRKRNPERSAETNRTLQNTTLDKATRHGQQWTGPELELAARTDLTAKAVALMIGRSYWAVVKMRQKLCFDPAVQNFAGVSRNGASR